MGIHQHCTFPLLLLLLLRSLLTVATATNPYYQYAGYVFHCGLCRIALDAIRLRTIAPVTEYTMSILIYWGDWPIWALLTLAAITPHCQCHNSPLSLPPRPHCHCHHSQLSLLPCGRQSGVSTRITFIVRFARRALWMISSRFNVYPRQ